MEKSINILFAVAEAAPFAKVGGLGDVAGALPEALNKLDEFNFDVRIFMPFHARVHEYDPDRRKIGNFTFSLMSGDSLECELFIAQIGSTKVYLIDNEYINHNSPIYHGDWRLDGLKYVNFSLMVLEASKFINWKPDILHCNDWHTALAINALDQHYANDSFFKDTRTVLSIHNLPYNGWGSQEAMSQLGFSPSTDPDLPDWAKFTPLPMGIAATDLVIAVSPGYAKEIQTPEYGCGLENYLSKHSDKVMGILNGLDIDSYNPETDEVISHSFSSDRLYQRLMNKLHLQSTLGLEVGHQLPLMTMVSRLSHQKGIDLLLDSLEQILDLPWQFVLLGTGDPELEERANNFAKSYPEKFVALLKYDENTARQLYASGDIFTMPSRYEPCGLSQMIAMRYGNIPVASATGGLKNSIFDYSDGLDTATGFLSHQFSVEDFSQTLGKALSLFTDKVIWTQIQRNAMAQDFSWHHSAITYAQAYLNLINPDIPENITLIDEA